MLSLTSQRKLRFANRVLASARSPIGFVDVGSGGALKDPWRLLPAGRLSKFDFDPEELRSTQGLPLCISDEAREREFYVARDARSSSLHRAAPEFVARYDRPELLTREVMRVTCATLDEIFAGRERQVDALDVNVEGHDFQVLQGARKLLTDGFAKCVKVEFELVEVWQGQGWFADIDRLMRDAGFDLARLEVEYARPASVKAIAHRGEPLWGKAVYVPAAHRWRRRAGESAPVEFADDVLKGIVLYLLLDLPGRAMDLVALAGPAAPLSSGQLLAEAQTIFRFAGLDRLATRVGASLRWRLIRR
jgi:FkbM family methyltransferase